ncbi:hypothetical protein R50076_01020 [Gilvimarinus japonicus]
MAATAVTEVFAMDAIQRRRWLRLSTKTLLIVLVVLYFLYVLLGYFYLPGKLKSLAETQGTQMLGRSVSAESFSYNPFTFELKSVGFAIADEPEHPLLSWQQLRINAGFWATLWNRHLVIEEVELTKPDSYIHQNEKGFNFDPIIARLNERAKSEPAPTTDDSSSFAFTIALITIDKGDARYRDSSGDVNADLNIANLSLTFNDLYIATGDELLNPFKVSAALANGGQLSLTGEYRLQPLLFDIDLQAERLNLTAFADFLRNKINADLTNGALAASAQIHIAHNSANDGTTINLKQGSLTLTDLALDDDVQDPPMLRAEKLGASGIELDLLARSLSIEALEYRGMLLNQWQTKDGQFRYESLLVKTGTDSNQKANAPDESTPKDQWSIVVNDFVLADSTMNFSDQHVTPAVSWQLSDIDIHATPLHLTEAHTADLTASAVINQNTNLSMTGELIPVPLKLDLGIKHGPLQLSVFNPYLDPHLQAAITQGTLASDSTLKLTLKPELNIDLQTNAQMQAFTLINSATEGELLSIDNVDVSRVQLNVPSLNTQIDAINVQKPEVTLIRDTPANWDLLAKSSEDTNAAANNDSQQAPKTPETEATESAANPQKHSPTFSLNKFTLEQGKVNFTDRLQNPDFVSSINELSVELSELSTAATNPSSIAVSALFNQHAPFQLNGQLGLNPEHLGVDVKGSLKNLELAPMSSYTGTYIGYQVDDGKLSYNFNYKIDGNKLNGENNILAKSFNLGSSVDSDKAINAPIKLGLALLRDLQGNIDLDLDISGDTTDPSFNVPGLIAKAFVNILVKAAASPFTLLGSLVDSDDDLGAITFAAGSGQLNSDNQDKLQQLIKALNKKTNLNLVIRGNAGKLEERPAIQRRHLAALLNDPEADTNIATLAAMDYDLEALLDNDTMLQAIEDYYRQQTDNQFTDQLDAIMQEQSITKERARVLLAEKLFKEMAANIKISSDDMERLANVRAQAITTYLTDRGLASGRINSEPAYSAALTGATVELTVAPNQ